MRVEIFIRPVIAFLVSQYEVWKVQSVVWPESEDKIPPKATEMEERLLPPATLAGTISVFGHRATLVIPNGAAAGP